MTGQKKTTDKPPATQTIYEVSVRVPAFTTDGKPRDGHHAWEAVANMPAANARAAIRSWVELHGTGFAGGVMRAVPLTNITETPVGVRTKREITLGETPPETT